LRAFEEAGSNLTRIKNYKVWQDGNHPVELDTNKMLEQRLAFSHYNPVEQGLVFEPESYCYSSAIDYSGGNVVLEIEMIE